MINLRYMLKTMLFVFVFFMSGCISSNIIGYKTQLQSDGGYILEIDLDRTNVVSAEGFYLDNIYHYKVVLIGAGKDWSYRNQRGYYYSQNEIAGIKTGCWDFGYAWVDIERKYLYLNLYWVESPDNIRPSEINGKYKLESYP